MAEAGLASCTPLGAIMARIYCPGCNRKLKLPQHVLEATIRCPHCTRVFQTVVQISFPVSRPSILPGAEESRPEPDPLLTSPHSCQHCGVPLTSPIARTSATVVCDSCGNKTSVYAVLHRCSVCRQLLESPSKTIGTETACPGCKRRLRVPQDVLRIDAPSAPEELWFGCYCPSCSEEVAVCEKDVGSFSVCPHCLVPFDVPHGGHYLEGGSPQAAPDPLDALHEGKEVACPNCQTHFPARADACPVCGKPTPSPSPW
jgi:hypothetical protein